MLHPDSGPEHPRNFTSYSLHHIQLNQKISPKSVHMLFHDKRHKRKTEKQTNGHDDITFAFSGGNDTPNAPNKQMPLSLSIDINHSYSVLSAYWSRRSSSKTLCCMTVPSYSSQSISLKPESFHDANFVVTGDDRVGIMPILRIYC